MSEKKRALVLASFRDAGTGESYVAGEIALLSVAIHANYEAGGLVGAAPAKAKKVAKPKPKRTVKAKAPAAKADPAPSLAPLPVTAPEPADTAPDGDADA